MGEEGHHGGSARAESAAEQEASAIHELIHSMDAADLKSAATDRRLTEDLALTLLKRRDLPPQVLEGLATNSEVMKHRRVLTSLVAHPSTPRHVSLPVARRLYTFELARLVLLPSLASDLKLAIEQAIIARFGTTSAGERLTLAKRGSTRVAAALLADADTRVMDAALNNARMTESFVVAALMRSDVQAALVQRVSSHQRWSNRREVQLALLRNQHTPLARAIQWAETLPAPLVADLLRDSRLAPAIKRYLQQRMTDRTH